MEGDNTSHPQPSKRGRWSVPVGMQCWLEGTRSFIMKIISWNVAWGGPGRTSLLKIFLESSKLMLSCFWRLKNLLSVIHLLGHFGGGRNEEWIYSSSNGSAGGMLIGWKTELFKLEAVAYGAFSIICRTVRLQVGVFLVDFMYIWPLLQIFAKKNFS